MQKHNDWLSNRGYIQHLQVLKKIQVRKAQPNKSSPRQPHERSTYPEEHSERIVNEDNNGLQLVRSKETLNMRDQQILWDNYYLGKRIIETPPVISKRRLDEEYRKHRRLVQCLTASNGRKAGNSEFRVKSTSFPR